MDDYSDVNEMLVNQLKAKVKAYNEIVKSILRGEKFDVSDRLFKVFRMPEESGGFKL